LALIYHVRQHERRLDRIQRLRRIEHAQGRRRPTDTKVPEEFSGAPLCHQTRAGFRRWRACGDDLNVRKFSFESFDRGFDVIPLIEKNTDPPFLLCRQDAALPFGIELCVCSRKRRWLQ